MICSVCGAEFPEYRERDFVEITKEGDKDRSYMLSKVRQPWCVLHPYAERVDHVTALSEEGWTIKLA